jgi:hypothetical protein
MDAGRAELTPRPFRSLANRLIHSIVAAGAICTLVVAALQIVFTFHDHRRNFEAEVDSIARINVPLLSVNLWDIEPDAIRRQLKLMAERPQIAHVRLDAVSGQEFESGNPARRGNKRTVTLDVPYPAGKPGRLGTLQIAPNIDHLYAALAGDVLRVLCRIRTADRPDLLCRFGHSPAAVATADAAHRRIRSVSETRGAHETAQPATSRTPLARRDR